MSLRKQIEQMEYLSKQIDHTEHTGSGAYFTWKRKAQALADKMPSEWWENMDTDETTDRPTKAEKWIESGDRVKLIETRNKYRRFI